MFSNSVTAIDGASNAIVATGFAEWQPQSLCYNPASNRVYCANYGRGGVTVIDGETNARVAGVRIVDKYPWALCLDPQSNRIYCVCDSSCRMTVIDCASNAVVDTAVVGDSPRAIVWSPTVQRLYVANQGSSDVSVLRLGTVKPRRSIDGHPKPSPK